MVIDAQPAARWRPVASSAAVVLLVVAGATIWLSSSVGWTWRDAVDAFVVSNCVLGLSFGLCGVVIARNRPGNAVGWLLVADGLGHLASALAAPATAALIAHGAPLGWQRVGVTAFQWFWPWSIGLCLPLALLLFPDGRLPSSRWRLVGVVMAATSPLFVAEMVFEAAPVWPGYPLGLLAWSGYDSLAPLWAVSELRILLCLGSALLALVVRYRRAEEPVRGQILWLASATVVLIGVVAPWAFVAGTPILVLFVIPVIPLAVTVAIVRHQLLDIRLVISRALAWLLLTLLALAAYVVLVALLDRLVAGWTGQPVAATVVIALAAAPLLPRLQRLVDRLTYGDRRDPARIVSSMASHLASSDSSLDEVAASLTRALRMPYAAVLTADGQVVGSSGESEGRDEVLPLVHGTTVVGHLRLGLRPGEATLTRPDRRALDLVGVALALALHATALTAEVQASRERTVGAREEERRHLRRALHDGLGPTLTGLALAADAAANLRKTDPGRADALVDRVRMTAREAVDSVRRVVDELRPAALDELGLVEALRQRAEELSYRPDGSRIAVRVVTGPIPALPAAIEVAAYRIATEALTNVARHARASTAEVRLRCHDCLDVEVIDDGRAGAGWQPGVGMGAMRERAAELGGSFEAGPTDAGGRVFVSLPLDVAVVTRLSATAPPGESPGDSPPDSPSDSPAHTPADSATGSRPVGLPSAVSS